MAKVPPLTHSIGMLDTRSVAAPPKLADPHYSTREHKQWRLAVLIKAGFRCEDCGRSGCRLYADHVDEIEDGGAKLDPRNGRCRCGSCHTAKTIAERAKRMAR